LKIPDNQYTLETFIEYIVDNLEEVFEGRKERKTLKAYLIYVIKDWKTIFSGLKLITLGDIVRISFEGVRNNEVDEPSTDFYIYQWVPGLILMFTSSKRRIRKYTQKFHFVYKRNNWIMDKAVTFR
jgi:hypothetical protein